MRFLHTLTTIVLIFAVYLLDFTPHASLIQEARAQTTTTTSTTDADSQTMTNLNSVTSAEAAKSEQDKIDEANGTKRASKQKTNLDKNLDDENFILNLTAMAAAYATTTMIVQCTPIATDMYVAAGAGALWIAGEVMAAMKYKKAMNKLDKEFVDEYSTKKEDIEKQITALSLLKQSYMDAEDVIRAKVKMQRVASVGYIAAAAVAAAFYISWISGSMVNCNKKPVANNNNKIKVLISLLMSNVFIKEVQASSSPFWFLGGAALVYFTKSMVAQNAFVNTLIHTPWQRAVLYMAIFTLLTFAVNSTEDILNRIQDNIKKIDVALARLTFLAKDGLARKLQEQEYKLKNNGIMKTGFKVSDNPTEKTVCATNGTMGACPSVTTNMTNLPDFGSLPTNFQSLSKTLGNTADAISGKNTISSSALGAVDTLAGKSAILNRALQAKTLELLKKGNEKHKKNFDAGKLSNQVAGKLKANTRARLGALGMSPRDVNEGMSGFTNLAANASVKPSDSVTGSNLKRDGNAPVAATIPNAKDLDFNFDFKEDGAGAVADSAPSGATSVEEYETGGAEVHPDSKKNIFDIISGRYIKSGYPRLLEEEEL